MKEEELAIKQMEAKGKLTVEEVRRIYAPTMNLRWRELKFRQPIYSLKGEFKTFHYWGYIDGAFISPAGFLNVKQKLAKENNQNGQFTGLKDKSGKEIYEGDILRTKRGFEFYYNDLVDYHFWQNTNQQAFEYVEIIGSIHENSAQ